MAWGFEKQNNIYSLSDNCQDVFPKLIDYFTNNKIDYSLTDSSKNFLNQLDEANESFLLVKNKAIDFKNGKYEESDFKNFQNFLEENIPRKLRDHQVKAAYHLNLVENGANFSVPGAGKTTVVLAIYEKLRLEGLVNMLFVVGPPACFGPWKDEFEKVLGREIKNNFIISAGGNKDKRKSKYYIADVKKELYLTTYQTLLNDQDEVSSFLKNKNVKPYIVIDESHYIKQLGGSWADAVLNISEYSKYKCVLTGTPIPKSYGDLFNLLDFLWPDKKPISYENKAKLQIYEDTNDVINAGEILKQEVGPLFYRVRKTELGLKPQIFNPPDKISMNPIEKKVYVAIADKIKSFAREDYLKNIDFINILKKGRMMRMRQCLSYTKLVDTAISDYDEDLYDDELRSLIRNYDKLETPAKITRLLEIIKNSNNDKVVIWAHFIKTIELIERHLKKNGHSCKKIIGATPTEKTSLSEIETREEIINEFKNKESGLNILIANPAACAESISLHKTCHNAIYYDLSYNCAQYLQSLDRIHRVGGSENQEAYYHYLQYENTIDSDILNNLNRKADRMYQIIEGDYNIYNLDIFEDDNSDIEIYDKLIKQNENI